MIGDLLTLLVGALWGEPAGSGAADQGASLSACRLRDRARRRRPSVRENMPTQVSGMSWGSLAYQTLWVVCVIGRGRYEIKSFRSRRAREASAGRVSRVSLSQSDPDVTMV